MRLRRISLAVFVLSGCADGAAVSGDAPEASGTDAIEVDAGTTPHRPDAQAQAHAPPSGEDAASGCAGKALCGTACVDIATDVANCGRCGGACETGQSCVTGACSSPCPASTALCGGACVDTSSDPKNCGACGNTCPGATSVCAGQTCTATLRVRGFIDGKSDLFLKDGAAYWRGIQAAAPGLWNGHDEATFLNGAVWQPVWPRSGENRDCNCDSQSSPAIPPLAAKVQTVHIQVLHARDQLQIAEQPSAANGYTARVEIKDGPGGADWYEFVLTYETR